MYNYTADKSLKHQIILPRLQINSCMFRALFHLFRHKKCSVTGDLTSFRNIAVKLLSQRICSQCLHTCCRKKRTKYGFYVYLEWQFERYAFVNEWFALKRAVVVIEV